MNYPSALRALNYRNYRLFAFGQGVSLIGTWMQQIALSWLVFDMTGSSLQLSFVLFCGQIPSLIISPLAGVLIDRWRRHHLLLVTQSLAMLQAITLAYLTLTHQLAIWMVWPLSLFLGTVTAFDIIGRQAFLSEMVPDRHDLMNAIALNSSVVNGARLIGPALGATVLAMSGSGMAFLLNALSYMAVLVSLIRMDIAKEKPAITQTALLQGLRDGFRYAFGFVPIRAVLLSLSVASMAGASYNVLLPELSVVVLGGNTSTLGMLNAASGAGALIAAAFLATRKSVVGMGIWIIRGAAVMGIGLIAFTNISSLAPAALALLCIGFGMMVQMSTSNSLLQTIADPDKKARVMSFYTMAFLGMAPVGSLLTGLLVEHWGMQAALAINGAGCLLSAVILQWQLPRLRAMVLPVYIRLKLVEPLVQGIQGASVLRHAMRE
jgi:MFS family permease